VLIKECVECGDDLEIDEYKTIESYITNNFGGKEGFYLFSDSPPEVPAYFILSCANPACGFSGRFSFESIIQDMGQFYAEKAWSIVQAEKSHSLDLNNAIIESTNKPLEELGIDGKSFEAVLNHPVMKKVLQKVYGNKES